MTIIQAWDRIVDLEKEILKLKAERDIYREVYHAAKEFKYISDATGVPIKRGDRAAAKADLYRTIQDAEDWEQDL